MSNDTEFSLRFCHRSRAYLERVRAYAEEKKARWDASEKKVGARRPNSVVSWGFLFDAIEADGDGFRLPASVFANQSFANVPITGDDGELADLLARFPELVIEGEFRDEYGRGTVFQTEQEYEDEGLAEGLPE